jgi:Sulfotransferase family
MRSCVILGSGRSGTSMLAGMLHSAGYYMGDQLLPPTSSNPKGYFEDRVVNELNEDLLVQLLPVRPSGKTRRLYPWRLSYGHQWLAVLSPETTVQATPALATRIQSVICQRPFCFKDPRFCYTLEAWRPMLGDAAFLCVFREPGRTASSMITDSREQTYLSDLRLTRRRALRVWTSMYRHIIQKHRCRGQWLFVHYDQIFDGSAIPRIENLVEANITTSFVDRSLRRSVTSDRVPRSTADIYDQLCLLADYDMERGHAQ